MFKCCRRGQSTEKKGPEDEVVNVRDSSTLNRPKQEVLRENSTWEAKTPIFDVNSKSQCNLGENDSAVPGKASQPYENLRLVNVGNPQQANEDDIVQKLIRWQMQAHVDMLALYGYYENCYVSIMRHGDEEEFDLRAVKKIMPVSRNLIICNDDFKVHTCYNEETQRMKRCVKELKQKRLEYKIEKQKHKIHNHKNEIEKVSEFDGEIVSEIEESNDAVNKKKTKTGRGAFSKLIAPFRWLMKKLKPNDN